MREPGGMDTVIRDIREFLSIGTTGYGPLLLLVGPQGSGKTALLHRLAEQHGYPCRNLSLELASALLGESRAHLSSSVPEVLQRLVSTLGTWPLLLDDMELLFAPFLHLDVLRLLRDLSRLGPLVVAWPGEYQGQRLTYARPGHPEYREHRCREAWAGVKIVPLGR